MLFNTPIRALLPQIRREPIHVNSDDEHCEALKSWQEAYLKNNDTWKDSPLFSSGFTLQVQIKVELIEGISEDNQRWSCRIHVKGQAD